MSIYPGDFSESMVYGPMMYCIIFMMGNVMMHITCFSKKFTLDNCLVVSMDKKCLKSFWSDDAF